MITACDNIRFLTTQQCDGRSRKVSPASPSSANQLATHVRHFPRIKSGDTCIGFPRHVALPSSTTQNVAVLCPHHRATQATAGIGWPWRQGRGTPPSRLSIVWLGTIWIAVCTRLSPFSSRSATQDDPSSAQSRHSLFIVEKRRQMPQ